MKEEKTLFIVSADTCDNGYGAEISVFGVTDNEEMANDILNKCGYANAEINPITMNKFCEIYLGGYYE